MTRRLKIYFAAAFVITWISWWTLALLTRAGITRYGRPAFMLPYMLGGLGPAIAAYAAVLATASQAPLREFHARLFRWRVSGWWYVVAVGLPVALALASVGVAASIDARFAERLSLRPWYVFVPLFFFMIAGGGLEELGWRGVAQPETERRLGRPAAAALVGVVWSLWHLPLFFIPGVGQYGANFALFAVGLVGAAMMLAWLYGRTRSILLCVLFHAAWNAIAALGWSVPPDLCLPAVGEASLRLAVGAALLIAGSPRLEKVPRSRDTLA
jgi:membrane protease YdiL (CAAX protease family)